VLLFKLHGSVTWRHNYLVGEYVHIDDELPRIIPGYGEALIYPLQPKVSFMNPVLELLNAYFTEALRRLRMVIAVGYSFRDAHVRLKLGRAKRHNPRLHVAVIDPSACEIGERLSGIGFRRDMDLTLVAEKFGAALDYDRLLGRELRETPRATGTLSTSAPLTPAP
jgi:hypothetical protein